MKLKIFILTVLLLPAFYGNAQNLVINGSLEDQDPCNGFLNPQFECASGWNNTTLENDGVNTPDICFEGAVFFPPSSIDAYDGNNYLGIECSAGNPEYVQAPMASAMQAGVSYCVSFYASVNDQSDEAASLGILFTDEPLTNSPFELELIADVQGDVPFDPTSWTLITGTYTATGGEDIIVIGGFENTGQMPQPYMYVDQVSVVAMPSLILTGGEICEDETMTLDAFALGAQYAWSTGEFTSFIEVHQPGTYSVIRTLGTCTQDATAEVTWCEEENPSPIDTLPADTILIDSSLISGNIVALSPFYVPNTFTPDQDGINDVFFVSGPQTEKYELLVFDRWGAVVFNSRNVEDRWTGNDAGGAFYAQDGVYSYLLTAAYSTTELFEKRGHILVLR